ncbi:hypothetical protein ColLi_06690 [Colletotrichum liriopes]|uniref:Involucrin repeat protein n=1 Tax=Colletotrichum liriopes TaxID=708192 RepID=A0AA37GNU6_9PEZI|nr:hypothetical protein ColLi_06690 [Colletotrichum liriopes]
MMRDPRRRSPESSRRRRRERRDSREQLATSSTVSGMPGPSAQPQPQPPQQYQQQPLPQMYSQSQYPQSYADPQRYPEPERYAARPERYDDPQRYAQPQPQQYPQPDQYPPTEAFVNPLGYTEQQPYVEPQGHQGYRESEKMRPRGGSSSSSSSSTSSSFLNISAKSPKFGGVFSTFFRAPSEQRKRRRRKKQMARILSFGNSSSSSVNSDLAYGRGYIERDKSQRASPRPQGHPSPALHRGDAADGPQRPPPAHRDKTDEEILEIGRQLQDIARKQNQADLKAASKSRTSQIAGAAAAAAAFSHFRPKNKSDSKTRGSGTSKPNENGSSSDDDWESASEDESTTDESDNDLVYGSVFKPAKSARISSEPPEQIKPPERKSTIVDPRLFGPVNSLRGAVKSPCGFGEEDPRSAGSSRRHHEETIAQVESPKSGKQPMQRIYPVPTSDPDRFDYDRSSVTSSRQDLPQRARPEPVPIQQPIPIVPVSSKVYDAERFEEDERTKQRRPPPKGRSAAENAIAGVGVAAAAIGAAMASNRRDSGEYLERRDDRRSEVQERREDPRDSRQSRRNDEPEQPIRIELDDRETRKQEDPRRPHRRDNADVIDERDKKRIGRSDPVYEALKRREAEPDPRPEVYRLPQGDEIRVEYDPNDDRRPREEPKEPRRDDRKPVVVDERRETMRVEKPTELPRENHGVEQPEAPSTQAPIDPFQFQVADDAFQTPKYATPKRPLTPQVVTVDREPNFDSSPPRKPDYSESRMSRKDSFELEQRLERYQQGARDRSRTPGPHRRRDSIEDEERAAKLIYDEAKHATVPVAAAAVASAIAVEEERSRKHRHDQTTEDGSRNRPQAVKDVVQEEADKYYRETVIARKIAKDEMRSRSSSPHDQSVVGKWQEHDDGPEIVTIVTPPEMDHPHDKSPYDAPNADVRIDHVIIPEELSRFRLPGRQLAPGEVPIFQSRDPSCERERPLLNLVLPTPVVTPRHTPAPEQQKEPRPSSRTQEAPQQRSVEPADAPSSEVVPAAEIVLGPKGEVIERPTTPSAKSVTWGDNETKSFNMESPEPPKKTASTTSTKSKKKKKLSKSSPWGIISAAVGSGAAAAAAAPEMRNPFDSKPDEDRERHSPPESPKSRGIEPLAEPTVLPASPKLSTSFEDEHDLPPAPGPKPSSPQTSRMPGAFADDLEFASVLAAGLQDTGFDPNIVIDNPTYMRRDSPPGQSEPAVYQQPFAETVTDLGIYGPEGSAPAERGFVMGEVPETPVAERDLGGDHAAESPRARERRDKGKAKETPLVEQEPPVEEVEPSKKLSKKEKRKQKAAKRQSMDNAPADETYGTPEATSRPEPTPFSETAPGYERPRSYYDVPGATPQDGPSSFADSGPVYDRPHTYYGVPEPTPLSESRPYSDAVSAHDRSHSYYGAPEMTSRNEPTPYAETTPHYERPHIYYDTPQSPETVVALGPKTRGFQDVPTWSLPASSDVPRAYGETLASAASASETAPADYEPVLPSKSSKKEKKKKSRSSRSEVIVVQEDEDEPSNERPPHDEPSASRETLPESDRYRSSQPQETGEDAWETPATKKKSKKSKQSSDEWTDVEKQSDYTPAVERRSTRDDLGDWDDLPPKSQRDRSRFEDRDVSSVASDPSSRREKSDRRSKSSRHEDRDASSIVSDPASRREKSERRSKSIRDEDRDVSSVVSDPSSRRDKSERRSHSSRYDDRDASSVVSEPATRSEKSERRSKSIRDEERDTSSLVSDRSSRRDKTDRRSNGTRHDDGDDAKSVASGSSGRKRRSDDQKSPKEEEKRSSGFFNNLFRGGNSKDVSGKDEKSSFLDNAGTLGAGAGLASAVAALGSMMSRSNATEPQLEESANVARSRERSASPTRDVDIDPEIMPRVIRPAIDPQYGDFLPLPPSPMPPSTPGSPTQELEELPALPDSRPETPPEERRRQHETKTPKTHTRKRSNLETPTRSPSQTAVPFKLRLGQRSTPSSPGTFGVSPVSSPTVPTAPDVTHVTHVTPPTPASHARRPSRPISWESSREIKPLYLLEQARQESAAHSMEPPIDFPELPPSEPSSRESPAPEFSLREDDVNYFNQLQASPFEPNDLRIDTNMSQYPEQSNRHFGSQETTPKAEYAVQHTGAMFERASPDLPELPEAARRLGMSDHELGELPALPASPLASPVVPDVVRQSDLSQPDPEQLPALPDSPPDSPPMRPEIGPVESISQERNLYGPASPALPVAADTDRHLDLSQTELDGLPALPASPMASPTTHVTDSVQQPDIPIPKLEELPALPDSPVAYPTAMPEPEPVETTSKERSSYLLHMTPPSIIKNLMDRDAPDTPPSPTPNRSHDTIVATADIEEQDLIDSHKTALGALAGGAAAGLAAASLIDHARTEDKAIEIEPEDKALETSASAEPPVEGKKSKKEKKKKKAKGASTDNATLPSADIASPVPTDKVNLPSIDISPATPVEEVTLVSNEAARSMSTDEQATPLPPTEHPPSTSVWDDQLPSVDTVPTALIEDATTATAESTTQPSIGAAPTVLMDGAADQAYPTEVPSIEVSSAEFTGNDLLPPLPSASAEEEVFLSNDTDLPVSANENALPSIQDNQPLESSDKVPLELANPLVVPAEIDQASASGPSPAEGDIPGARDAAADGEVAGPAAAELLAEDTAGGKKLSKKERKKLLKIKKAWEQAQAEMQQLERSAEPNEKNSKAASDTDAPLTSLPEPDNATETNEVEEAAAIPLPDVLDPAEEEALLSPEDTTEMTPAEQAIGTQLPAVLDPALGTSLPEPEKGTKTTESEQAAIIPPLDVSESAVEASLNSLGDAEKAEDVQEPEQLGPTPAFEEPIENEEKPLGPVDDAEPEKQAPVVVDQQNLLPSAEQAQESQQGLVTEVTEAKSSNAESNSSNQQLPLPPPEASEEKTVEPIEVPLEPQAHPLEFAEKSVEPSNGLGEQQTALQDQDDKSVEQDVASSELQSVAPAQETSLKLDDNSQEQQTSATQPFDAPATTDSQQEQPASVSEIDQTTEEPTVESREIEEPSAPLSKKQKKKLKKAKKSLTADDEPLAAVEVNPTEPQPEPQPEPVADQVPLTSNLGTVPKDASISEALPAEPVVDTTTAAVPVEQAVEDASGPVHTEADAAAVPLPEDATETFEEITEEEPKPVLAEVASAIPLPDDIPTVPEEASEPALTEPVASAVPVSEDAPEETTTTGLETSDSVPTAINNGETPTSEPASASVEAPPAESAQPEPSGKKKNKKKKKGKGASLSQLDDVMSAETTPLQSPGVQTPTTEAPVGEPFGMQAPTTDNRTIDTSIVEPSANEAPAVEVPSAKVPSVESPAVETTTETLVAETPVVETPVVEPPAVETSSGEPLSIGADVVEATSSAETPAAEPVPSDGVLAETLAENPLVDESITKTQPTDIASTEAQQTEDATLQATEPGLVTDKAAVMVDIPETPNSSSIPDEQIETPALAEETSKTSKKSKKKKKKDKKAVEADSEVAAVVADDIPAEPLDVTSHNLPADEKPVETDRTDVQEPVVTVNQTQSSDVNVTDSAAEEPLNAESQTPTMTESQDDAFVTPPQVPATPESQVEAPENLSQEPTLVDSQIDSFDAKPQEPLAEEDQDRGLDSPIEPEASTSSKKSKKKAKKAAAAAAAAAAATIVSEPTTEDATKDSDDKKEAKDETITDDGISNIISDKTGEMEQSSQEPPTSGEFATDSKISEEADPGPTVTKKGKKKKKGKKSSTLDLEPENSPSTSTLETTADVANTREQSAYMTSPSGEPSSDEIPFPQADTPTEAEWPASATASKKKRKSVTWAPELESFSASPEPPLLGEDEGPLEDPSTTETASVSETALEAEPQLGQVESVAGGSPEAITHGELVASQGIDIDQAATSEAEKDLDSEGQAQMRQPASEPSEALSGLQDTTPNPGNHFPSLSGLDTTRGVAGEPIAAQQTHSPSDPQMVPTPASSSMDDVEVANRKGGETLSREVDTEQVVSAEADATADPEPAGRPDTIDEPSAGANTQTGEVGIQDPGLHVGVGAASGWIDDKSLGDTQNGRIADAQPVGPALTDSALEAGDPQDTPVIALANQDTNVEIPQPLDHVPNPLEAGKISEAGITDASIAEHLLLEDEQHDKISDVEKKEEAGEAKKDEKEDSHDPLATDAGFPGQSDNSESLEPIASEPQLEPLSEALPGPELTGDVSTTQSPDQTETQAGQEDDVRSEPSSSSKMSKKDKKSKKKTKAASAEPVPQDDVQELKKQIVDDGAPAVRAVDEPVQAPEQADPEPSPSATNALEVAPVTEAVEAGEDEWAIQPAGKKSKKDKKKRAAAEAAAATTEQNNEPVPETSEVSIEAEVPSQPALDEASKVDVVGDQQPSPADTTETLSNAPDVTESKESQENVDPVQSTTEEVYTPSQPTTDIPGNSVTTNEELGATEEADATGFEPAKKSKKDKKRKKKQSISLVDSQELASPTAQPEESEFPEGKITSAPPHNTLLPNTEQRTADDVPPSNEATVEDLQKTAVQDEPIMKSEEAPAAQDSTTTEPIEPPAADNSETTPELASDQLKDTGSAPQTGLETLGDSTTQLQEEESPAVTKKSKKDKKKKKGLASSTPDEAPATLEPGSGGADQPTFSAADQTSEPSVLSSEAPIAEEQTPKTVEEAISAEAAPTTESPLTPLEGPVVEEQASTPADKEASTSKESKKDRKKKKDAPVDTPEERLPILEAEAVPEPTTVTEAAENIDEPALPAIEETTQPKDAPVEEPALAPGTTQPMERPIEAEPTEDKPVNETAVTESEPPKTEEDPFAGLSKKAKKKKMAEMAAATALAEATAESAAVESPTPGPAEAAEENSAEAPAAEKTPEEQPAREAPAEEKPATEPEPAIAVDMAPETTLEPPQVEKDPFAGLNKKQKKKKMAEMEKAAAEAEAAAAVTPIVEIEKTPEETVVKEEPANDKPADEETPAEEALSDEQPATETPVENPPTEEKAPSEPEPVTGPDTIPESTQEPLKAKEDPFAGLSKKQKKKKMAELAAAAEAEATAVEGAAKVDQKLPEEKRAEEPPSKEKLTEQPSVEELAKEKPVIGEPVAEEPVVEEQVAEAPAKEVSQLEAMPAPNPEPEAPEVEKDPFDGLSKKQKKKKMAEMAAAAEEAAAEAAAEAEQESAEKPLEKATPAEDKPVDEKPVEIEVLQDESSKGEPKSEPTSMAKLEPASPPVEEDPFAGLNKKQKKKKMAELAAAAEKAAEEKSLEETSKEAAVEDKAIQETHPEVKPVEELPIEDKPADEKLVEEASAPETPQAEEDPFAGLDKKEKKKLAAEMAAAAAVSEPASIEATQTTEEKPAEAVVKDKAVEEKPFEVVVEEKAADDKPAEENVAEQPEPEPPIVEKDPFAGLNKKQKKKKMAEIAAAAEAAATEAKEVIEEKIADNKAEAASEQAPALEIEPSASIEDVSKEESLPESIEKEAPKSAGITNPEDEFPVLTKKSKKDKKKKGKPSQSDPVVEPDLEPSIVQRHEPELPAQVPPTAQDEVENMSLEAAQSETTPSGEAAGSESALAKEQLPAVEEAALDQQLETVQSADPEQELSLTENKTKAEKAKKEKGLTELESEPQPPTVTVPQDDQGPAVETPSTEIVSADQAAVVQPEDLSVESQTRSVDDENQPVAPATPDVNAEDEFPLTGKKAKKAKKKKGKSLDLTESEPSTEPASEVTESAVEPIAESVAEPVTVPSTEESLGTSNSAEATAEEPSPTAPGAPLDQHADRPAQPEAAEQTNDEPAKNAPEQAVADETQSVDVAAPGPSSQPIDDDLSAPKLSKKDKKKKKKGKLQDDSNPPSGTATPTVLETSDPLTDPSSATQDIPDTSSATILSQERELPLEALTIQETSASTVTEEIPLSSDLHSSKATADEAAPEPDSSNSTILPPVEADLPQVNSTPVDDTSAKDAAVVESALPATSEEPIQAAPESAIVEPEEESPTTTKKSKKDKKKNKSKSADSVLVEPEESTPSATGLAQNLTNDIVEAKEAPVIEAEVVSVPAESAPTEIPAKTTIKAPAEAHDDTTTTAPVEAPAETPAIAPNDASAEAAAQFPNLDEFPTVQKKSKKDKKKKKGKSQDDSDVASATATPAEILDAESQAKQSPDVSVEPPAEAAFQDADQPAIPSTPEPTTSQDQPQTEDLSVDETLATTESPAPPNVPIQEVENLVTESQPPAEEERPVTTPAKKPKKDKKNRKSKAGDDSEMGSGTATPLEATAEEAKEVAPSKDITTREEVLTSDNKVAADLPIVEPPAAATVPEVSAQDLVQEVEEPRSPIHETTQEQHAEKQPDASTSSETLTVQPDRGADEPVFVEEPQEFVIKKSKKNKKKTESALVEPEPTVPAIEESSAAPEDLVANSVQEPSTAEPATETPVVESVEDTTALAEEWPEASTSKKSKKNKKKQSLIVESEVVAETQVSSTGLGTEPQTTLPQDDQTAKSNLPEAPVDTNTNSRALTNEPEPVSKDGPEVVLESTPGQQLQIETTDVAADNSSNAFPLVAQPTTESHEVGEAAKPDEQETAVESGPNHPSREERTTPAEEWSEVATAKKSKKDKKKKKRQGLSFDDAEVDSPLASGTATPKVVLAEEEAASKAESGTSHEAPADGASTQLIDVPFEQPAVKENAVTTEKSVQPLESSEPISTSEMPVDFNKVDEVTSSSQQELDQPHAGTTDTQVVEPVAQQVVDDVLASAGRTTEPIMPSASTEAEHVGERGPAGLVVQDAQASAAMEEPEDNFVGKKSKKDKKKKRASQALFDEPAAPVLETTEISEPVPVIEQAAPKAISEETSQETRGMDDVPQEPIMEEYVTKKSKKDKKKSTRLSFADEPETPLGIRLPPILRPWLRATCLSPKHQPTLRISPLKLARQNSPGLLERKIIKRLQPQLQNPPMSPRLLVMTNGTYP